VLGRGARVAGSVAEVPGDLLAHPLSVAESCLQRNAWVCPEYVTSRQDILVEATLDHLGLTFAAVLLGLVVALPLGVLASRSAVVDSVATAVATTLYAVPSLAMFPLLLALGLTLGPQVVVVGLAIYSLGILLRNIVVGLQEVPADTLDAADGMGLGRRRRLWSVELPLAMPAILAGLRIATVSTIALVTVGSLIGFGGLGDLILSGQRSNFNAQVLTASVIVVVLALLLDGALLLLDRALTPWLRRRSAT
jgi:osmoprotectant transport system permease protein